MTSASSNSRTGPIFVVGAPRSGTSILAWCLGQHPNIVNLPETNWLARVGEHVEDMYRLGTINGKHSHLSAIGLPKDTFYRWIGDGIARFVTSTNVALTGVAAPSRNSEFVRRRSEEDPKRRWLDATPQNTNCILSLSKLFPDAQFIHLLRDPREVVRSLSRFSRAGGRNYRRGAGFRLWLRMTRVSCKAERALGAERMMRVRYEEMVAQPDRVFRSVLAFLGEAFSEDCRRPLTERINSSQVGSEPYPRAFWLGRKAQSYYRKIIAAESAPTTRDEATYRDMEAEFLAYCRFLQLSVPEFARRAVARSLATRRKSGGADSLDNSTMRDTKAHYE